MSSRRAASPSRSPALAVKGSPGGGGGGLGSGKGSGSRPGSKGGLSLSGTAAAKRSPAAASPTTSERQKTYTQKPKPSALAGRLRHDPDGPSPQPSPSGGSQRSTASSEGGVKAAKRVPLRAKAGAAEADSPTESVLTVDTGVTEDTSAAAAEEEFVPEPDEETPFVPEEEEEGPATQGDHLMMAKAKMRRQRGLGSPGVDSPTNPFSQQGL